MSTIDTGSDGISDERIFSVLLDALEDGDALEGLAYAFTQIGAPSVPWLVAALRSPSPIVREEAVRILPRIADQLGDYSTGEIVAALLDDPNPAVRANAVQAMETYRLVAVVPRLIALLRDEHEEVCSRAADVLGEIGAQQVAPALINALDDEASAVRQAAAGALGTLGERRAVPALLRLLDETDWYTRSVVAKALGQIGDPAAGPELRSLFDAAIRSGNGRDRGERTWLMQRIVIALAQIGGEEAGIAAELLVSENPEVRDAAANACISHPDLCDVEQLRRLLDDPHVQASAARALGLLRDREAVPRLIEIVETMPSHVALDAAAYAIGMIGDARAIPALLAALRHAPDDGIATSVAHALIQIGDPNCLPALRAMLDDPGERWLESFAWIVSELGDDEAVPRLRAITLDNRLPWPARAAAITALARLRCRDAIPDILSVLDEDHEYLKWSVVGALEAMPDRRALPVLMRLLEDSNPVTKGFAAVGIWRIEHRDSVTGQSADD